MLVRNNGSAFLTLPAIFSLSVLCFMYMFFQYLLVPVVGYIAIYFEFDILFLERFSQFSDYGDAMNVALLGLFSFTVAWVLPGVGIKKKPLKVDWNINKAVAFACVVFFGNALYRALGYFAGMGNYPEEHYNNLLGPIWIGVLLFPSKIQLYSTLVAAIAYMSASNVERKTLFRYVISIVLIMVFSGLITRSRTALFAPVLCLIFLVALMGNREQLKSNLIILLIFIPLAIAIKNYIRSFGVLEDDSGYLLGGIGEIFQRMSMISNLSAVVEYFKDPVYGESIIKMFILSSGAMPDFFKQWAMEANPAYLGGNEFGRMFGLAASTDFNTGVALPFIGDLYLNFGLYGVALGMFVFGLFARFIQNRAIRKPSCSRIFLLVALVPLMVSGQEHQIGTWLSDLLRILIFYFLLLFLVRRTNTTQYVYIPALTKGKSGF